MTDSESRILAALIRMDRPCGRTDIRNAQGCRHITAAEMRTALDALVASGAVVTVPGPSRPGRSRLGERTVLYRAVKGVSE